MNHDVIANQELLRACMRDGREISSRADDNFCYAVYEKDGTTYEFRQSGLHAPIFVRWLGTTGEIRR